MKFQSILQSICCSIVRILFSPHLVSFLSFQSSTQLGIAIAFGFTISVLAYGIGHISGGHINPAVTLAFMVLKKQSIVAGLLYMLAQFVGAIFGSLLLWGCTASLTADCDSADIVGVEARSSGVCDASMRSDGEGYGPAFKLGLNTVGRGVERSRG